jgi:uncharacterized membrane protein YfhO
LILTDLIYPGWTVTVDGAPADPQVVEGLYRGVAVPAGAHSVIWSYQPRVVYWSMFISAAAWLCLATAVLIFVRRACGVAVFKKAAQ